MRSPRPGVRAEKSARDRLIRLAATHPTWALGFEDEVWWSRLAQPGPTRLGGARPAAPAGRAGGREGRPGSEGAGVLWPAGPLGERAGRRPAEAVWLRFVAGRPRERRDDRSFWPGAAPSWRQRARRPCCWCGTTPPGTSVGWCATGSARIIGRRRPPAGAYGSSTAICRLRARGSTPSSPSGRMANGAWSKVPGWLTAAELRTRVCATFDCPEEELLGLPGRARCSSSHTRRGCLILHWGPRPRDSHADARAGQRRRPDRA